MDREITITHNLDTNEMQLTVDGVGLTEAQAEQITRLYFAQLGQAVPGGVAISGAVERHKVSGASHAHVVEGVKRGR